MNLLPKEKGDFVKKEYWETFFKKRGAKAFEWYGEYPQLCGVLHKYIKPQDKMLVVGCGNSQLSADLYDVGYHQIVNVDISDTVIRQMREKNEKQRPDMKFLKMDVLNMEFADSEFSVALDKGTLDALMVDDAPKTVATIDAMFNEVDRTLRLMGRYIVISLLQEHILNKVVVFFSEKGWAVRIHRINTDDSDSTDKEFHMPIFAVVLTKFKKNPKLPQILEMCTQEEKIERFTSTEDVMNVVREMQYYAVIRQRISQRKVTEEQLSLTLYTDVAATPRYTLTIVDATAKLANKFAIFIVPQGRETEWMFSTDAGRQQLSQSAGFERLVVVTLDRNHSYTNLDAIQGELSTKVMELAPPAFKHGTKVPFLSLGNDIGSRKLCKQGTSPMSGDYVIEEVLLDSGITYRRLVFLTTQNIVQSEARLKTVSTRKKKGKGKQSTTSVTVDKSYLACQHHAAMVAGMSCVQTEHFQSLLDGKMSVVLIGLGGGGLPTFMHQFFPKVTIDIVDIDPEVVTIATEWFGFSPDHNMRVHVDDGIKFVETQRDKGIQSHVIMLDVDSKDVTVGMSCPPQPFVQPDFLHTIADCLHPGGVLILNLVARDEKIKAEVLDRLKTIFPSVYVQSVEDEVNDIVYAIKGTTVTSSNVVKSTSETVESAGDNAESDIDKNCNKSSEERTKGTSNTEECAIQDSKKESSKSSDSNATSKTVASTTKSTNSKSMKSDKGAGNVSCGSEDSKKNEGGNKQQDTTGDVVGTCLGRCRLMNKYMTRVENPEVDLASAMEELKIV